MTAQDLKRPSVRAHIYDSIDAEREHQISLGYTREHDLKHGGLEHLWHYSGKYAYAGYCDVYYDSKVVAARQKFIQAIALLVAAVELLDHQSSTENT